MNLVNYCDLRSYVRIVKTFNANIIMFYTYYNAILSN